MLLFVLLKLIFLQIYQFLFPLYCIFCRNLILSSIGDGIKNSPLCHNCHKGLALPALSGCIICRDTLKNGICEFCNNRAVFFNKLIYSSSYNAFTRNMIAHIKYHGIQQLTNNFIDNFIIDIKRCKIDRLHNMQIVPVPMNLKSFNKRGYNQLDTFIQLILKKYENQNWKLAKIIKKRSNKVQHFLKRSSRNLRVVSTFQIRKNFKNKLNGDCLIIDDIYTTGSTVNAIAKILKENGMNNIFVGVLCKRERIPSYEDSSDW